MGSLIVGAIINIFLLILMMYVKYHYDKDVVTEEQMKEILHKLKEEGGKDVIGKTDKELIALLKRTERVGAYFINGLIILLMFTLAILLKMII